MTVGILCQNSSLLSYEDVEEIENTLTLESQIVCHAQSMPL